MTGRSILLRTGCLALLLFAAVVGGCNRVRQPEEGPQVQTGPQLPEDKAWVACAAFSPDGNTVAAGYGGGALWEKRPDLRGARVRVWDARSGASLHTFVGHRGQSRDGVVLVGFLPGGHRLLSVGGGHIRAWDLKQGAEEWARETVPGVFATQVALSPDGTRLLTPGVDEVHLWDTASGRLLRTLERYTAREVRFAALGPLAYVSYQKEDGGGPRAELLEVATGNPGEGLELKWRPMAFSPDGRWAVSEEGGGRATEKAAPVLWDARTGKLLRRFDARGKKTVQDYRRGQMYRAAFSADGERLVTADDDGVLRVWDVKTGNVLADHPMDEGMGILALSADGALALSVGGQEVWISRGQQIDLLHHADSFYLRVWDTATWQALCTLDTEAERGAIYDR